jgi:SOS-response transcriptional repressor LexA
MRGTERRSALLAAIEQYWARHGYGPSIRDLVAMTGWSSTSVVDYHLRELHGHGLIDWDRRVARSIRVRERVAA